MDIDLDLLHTTNYRRGYAKYLYTISVGLSIQIKSYYSPGVILDHAIYPASLFKLSAIIVIRIERYREL